MSTMKDAQGKIDDIVAKKFADITMTTGDAAVKRFVFPMSDSVTRFSALRQVHQMTKVSTECGEVTT